MSDVYRTPGHACPTCAGASLREFLDRLVCDACNGMLISHADFKRTCEETSSAPLAIETILGATSEHSCPRCTRALLAVELAIPGKRHVTKALRCEADGLWIETSALVAMLALITPKGGGGRTFASSRATGADGLALPRGGGASSGLAISARRAKPAPREPAPAPIDPYAEQVLTCPRCADAPRLQFAGDRWSCATCEGAFVANDALAALVGEMIGAPWALPPTDGREGTRACPVCRAAMTVEALEAVEVDHCAVHGTWFDPEELGAVLVHAASPPPTGVAGWLHRMFK